MRVIVTRVQPQAQAWVRDLQRPDWSVLVWPLIDLQRVADPTALHAVWQDLPRCQAVMAVSAAAVQFFCEQKPPQALDLPALTATGLRAWATGPGTARAWLEAGCPAAALRQPGAQAAQLDSEALWAVVAPEVQLGQRVWLIRGADDDAGDGAAAATAAAPGLSLPDDAASARLAGSGRDWLAAQLQARGVTVQAVVAYQRGVPRWSADQVQAAQAAAQDGSVWLFSSAQAADHLARLTPGTAWGAARAVATHPRIGQALQRLGMGTVRVCAPRLAAVRASIESFA